ncbi:MAG TPA: hypothetical protein VLH56_02770 [Dissulfurispiraceae bacterium]|nr:hypothetical protein [Dissulfurispiraceae bacterium]
MAYALLVLVSLFSLFGAADAAERIETVTTRPNVTVPIYVQDVPGATSALLIFTGGRGQNFREADGRIKLSRNFLIRVMLQFAQRGLAVVVLGVPSDQERVFSDDYRTSHEHSADVQAVVQRINEMGYQDVFLIGTSRGTISTAHLGSELKTTAIKGVILTSTMDNAKFLRWVKLEQTPYPVLFVHHKNDYCKVSPVEGARRSAQRMKNSPSVQFVELDGGISPQSDECEPLSNHGFFGIEDKAVNAIVQWARSLPKKE